MTTGTTRRKRSRLLVGVLVSTTLLDLGSGFTTSSFLGREFQQQARQRHHRHHPNEHQHQHQHQHQRRRPRPATTTTTMVFDFFKNRATEGIDQLQNIASKTAQGKLGEALADTSAYVQVTNEKFYDGLAKSRDQLLSNLDGLFGGDMKLEDTLEQLEEVLMMADIGGTTTDEIISDLRSIAKEDSLDPDDIKSVLRGRLVSTLEGRGGQGAFGSLEEEAASAAASAADAEAAEAAGVAAAAYNPRAIRFAGPEEDPQLTVLMVIGANGMGKTTTIGKLANRLREEGQQKVMLAACDTFRAAAVDQLEMWADRAQVGFLGPEAPDSAGESAAASGDEKPATVLYRALDVAIKDEVDVLIVDTSGRLSNNVQLNEELKKMKRVVEKRLGRPPHEVLLVVDASIGRNAVDQARVWKDDVGVSGVVVTKLDGTARAGYVVAMTRDLGLPVKLIGVGEKIDDLRDFEPGPFVDALLGNDEAKAAALQERLDANLLEARSRAAEAERKRKEEVAAKQAAKDAKRNNGGGGGGLFGNFGGGGGGGGMEAPPSTAAEPLELVMMGDNESEASSSGFSSSSSSSSTRAKKKSSGAAKKNKKKKKKKN